MDAIETIIQGHPFMTRKAVREYLPKLNSCPDAYGLSNIGKEQRNCDGYPCQWCWEQALKEADEQ